MGDATNNSLYDTTRLLQLFCDYKNKLPPEPVQAPRADDEFDELRELLLFQHGYLRPAGGGFGEFAGGEAPDDELLALDPIGILGGLAVEVRAEMSAI